MTTDKHGNRVIRSRPCPVVSNQEAGTARIAWRRQPGSRNTATAIIVRIPTAQTLPNCANPGSLAKANEPNPVAVVNPQNTTALPVPRQYCASSLS